MTDCFTPVDASAWTTLNEVTYAGSASGSPAESLMNGVGITALMMIDVAVVGPSTWLKLNCVGKTGTARRSVPPVFTSA